MNTSICRKKPILIGNILGCYVVHTVGKELTITLSQYIFLNHFCFPAQLVPGRRFYRQRSGQAVVTDVVSSPRHAPSFSSRIAFSIPTARRFSSKVANSRSRFPLIILYVRKNPYEYVHSVRIEPTKLILVGTRITYQATGDACVLLILILRYNTLYFLN